MAIPAINVLGNPNVTEGNFQIAIEDLRKSVIGSGKAYDSANTYSQYDSCVYGGIVYYSKINSNTGNTPVIGTNWGLVSDLVKLVASPTTNALAKIQASGTINNSGIIEDANGNVGVGGATPSTWYGATKGIDIGDSSAFYGYNGSSAKGYGIASNAYRNSSGSYIYKSNEKIAIMESYNGVTNWFVAPSGIAGATAILTTAMSLDANSDLIVPHTYLNTTASAANMFVDSAGKFYRSTSSKQYKTDIEDIDNSYVESFFNNARPIYYKSLSNNDNPNWGYWGFIAEEIAEFDKRLVHWRYQTKEIEVEKERIIPSAEEQRDDEGKILVEAKDETVEKYIEIETVNDESKPMIAEGVMYERITVLLTAKVQEQQKIINDLKARIEALESK